MDQDDHHYVCRHYGLDLQLLFVAALTNACTVKPAQVPYFMYFKSAQMMVCPAEKNCTILGKSIFATFLHNCFIELRALSLKMWEKARTF